MNHSGHAVVVVVGLFYGGGPVAGYGVRDRFDNGLGAAPVDLRPEPDGLGHRQHVELPARKQHVRVVRDHKIGIAVDDDQRGIEPGLAGVCILFEKGCHRGGRRREDLRMLTYERVDQKSAVGRADKVDARPVDRVFRGHVLDHRKHEGAVVGFVVLVETEGPVFAVRVRDDELLGVGIGVEPGFPGHFFAGFRQAVQGDDQRRRDGGIQQDRDMKIVGPGLPGMVKQAQFQIVGGAATQHARRRGRGPQKPYPPVVKVRSWHTFRNPSRRKDRQNASATRTIISRFGRFEKPASPESGIPVPSIHRSRSGASPRPRRCRNARGRCTHARARRLSTVCRP